MDQFCVGWKSSGIEGLARKIFPTDAESKAGLICQSEDFDSPLRVVRLRSGDTAILGACYDMFGLSETPISPGRRTACIRRIRNQETTYHLGEPGFRDIRTGCIQRWDLLLRTMRPTLGVTAIHDFRRPGLDGFWQRHGIATASALLNGGLAIGAAHFRESLPSPGACSFASCRVPMAHLGAAGKRKAHRLTPVDAFVEGNEALVRLFKA